MGPRWLVRQAGGVRGVWGIIRKRHMVLRRAWGKDGRGSTGKGTCRVKGAKGRGVETYSTGGSTGERVAGEGEDELSAHLFMGRDVQTARRGRKGLMGKRCSEPGGYGKQMCGGAG